MFEPRTKVTLDKALKLLRDQFGAEEVVSDHFLKQLENYQPFESKDITALKRYDNIVRKGQSMLKSYPSLDILNTRIFFKSLFYYWTNKSAKNCILRS